MAGLRPAKGLLRSLLLCIACLWLAGCATFYDNNQRFQRNYQTGNIDKALAELEKSSAKSPTRDRLLVLLQRGSTLRMAGRWAESNEAFEAAYQLSEDQKQSLAGSATSLVSNPGMRIYRGEPAELIQIHYFKALNHLALGNLESALVEARRINLRLNELRDQRGDKKIRFRRDAFAFALMGMLFEASGDVNSAFISYRNAYEAYEEDYRDLFGFGAPRQLKHDLLRTAHACGFHEELQRYAERFGFSYIPQDAAGGQLVVLWNTGLGPVKDEWDINFVYIVKGGDGFFFNDELGLMVPFSGNSKQQSSLKDLKWVRVALPRYLERPPAMTRATVGAGGRQFPLEKVQDLNAISFAELEQARLRDIGEALLRQALKQSAEQAVSNQNPWLGMLMGLFNASTEKADTRNWQTLPYAIHYARLELPAGEHELTLLPQPGNSGPVLSRTVTINSGETRFVALDTPKSGEPRLRR